MYRNPIRKSLGLFVLYSIIIIGIFVLQFRNESVVSKNIGLLSVSFAQSQNEAGEISLKNSLQVSFKGITFTADDVTPLKLLSKTGDTESALNLSLASYEQKTPLSYTFYFSNQVSLTFAVSGTDSSAALSITADLPKECTGLYLDYKPTSGFSVTEKNRTKLILNSKNLTYAFTASQINEKNILFSPKKTTAYYVAYDPSVRFTFASLDSDVIIAQKSTYDINIKNFRSNIISSVADQIKTGQSLSEKNVIAYVAELASQGRYKEAVTYVPDSFKKGNKRTYLSAPYFNTLEAMYPTLEMYNSNMAEMIKNAIASNSLSIFTIDGLPEYLNILPDASHARELLTLPQKIFENEELLEHVRVSHASGILNTYVKLSSLHSNLADILLPVVDKCLEIIESNCTLTDSLLTLSEKNVPVSTLIALSTGNSLIQCGEFSNKPEYSLAGYALINSILSINTLDSLTLADAYPILIQNPFYPHYKLLSKTSISSSWAWTCAPNLSCTMDSGTSTFTFNFPKGETHYVIMSGINPFYEIEIYNLSFHSDPKFETYNSSGFIYRSAHKTLFLKSRHKSENEVVRLSHR